MDGTNQGLNAIGIIYLSTMHITELSLIDITLKEITNFFYCENAVIDIKKLAISNVVSVS